MDFLEELSSGVPVLGAPELRASLGLEYEGAAWLVLIMPLLLGVFLEAPILALSDRWPRGRVLVLSLVVQGGSTALAAWTSSPLCLGLALAIWGTAAGITGGVAQSALVVAHPQGPARILARAALFGMLGDAAAPALMAVCYALGASFRLALAVVAGLSLLQALALAAAPPPATKVAAEDEPERSWVEGLRTALAQPRLWVWVAAMELCNLLDEVLVVFGGMYLRDVGQAGPDERALGFGAFAVGGGLSLWLLDRWIDRVPARRLLIGCSLATLLVFCGWLLTSSAPLLAVLGAAVAPLYPLTQAQAYQALPGEPGLVAAVEKLCGPVELILPIALGAAADHFGISTAVTLLLIEPLGILIIAIAARQGAER